MADWEVVVWEDHYERWYTRQLDKYEQAVLDAAIEFVLEVHGIAICKSEFGKSLGDGLYEFRVRQSLNAIRRYADPTTTPDPGADKTVLLRVFVTFSGNKAVVLFHGLNKGKDSNEKRQQAEIKRARKLLRAYKDERLAEARRAKRGR